MDIHEKKRNEKQEKITTAFVGNVEMLLTCTRRLSLGTGSAGSSLLDTDAFFNEHEGWVRPYSTGSTNKKCPLLGYDIVLGVTRSDVALNSWFYDVGIVLAMQIDYRVKLFIL